MSKVKVKQGWLLGEELKMSSGVGTYQSFKGIPYAVPPVGPLRFKAPLPAEPWRGIRNATAHGSMCPQRDVVTNQLFPGNEDCLYLNVYTPNILPQLLLAVMVFIHGGGFRSGSGNDANYGPDYLVAHDVVLVTFNYRVEVLGFLSLGTEEVPGNAGLKDQVLALKWVKENIRKFGGDPDNITIFGQSAGAASVALHLLSPLSKGLFKRAISMSGVPFCDWAQSYKPRRRAFALGQELGFKTNDDQKLLKFLRSLPTDRLVDVTPCISLDEEVTQRHNLKMFHFTPVVEKNFGGEQFLTRSVLDLLKKGDVNDADLIIGHTNFETLSMISALENFMINDYNKYPETLVPRKIEIQSRLDTILKVSDSIISHYFGNDSITINKMREVVKYSSAAYFSVDIHRFLQLWPRNNNFRTYFYRFSSLSDRNIYGGAQGAKYGIFGAGHLDDLLYLFVKKDANLTLTKYSKEWNMIQLICTVFTNFAKYGNPTPDCSLGVIWPQFDKWGHYADIAEKLTVGQHQDAEDMAFWKKVYESAGLDFV